MNKITAGPSSKDWATPRRRASSLGPQPIRIAFDYQLQGMDAADEQYLRTRIMPQALAALQRHVMVKNADSGPLQLPRRCKQAWATPSGAFIACKEVERAPPWCFGASISNSLLAPARECPDDPSICTDIPGGPGVAGADLAVMVLYDGACSGHNAFARSCPPFHTASNRPLLGALTWCPLSSSDGSEAARHRETAVHEILHILAFDPTFWEAGKFLDADGAPRAASDSYRWMEAPARAPDGTKSHPRMLLTTPRVVQEVREHFGCPLLLGAEMEDNELEGTGFFHFEERLFQGDIMDGTGGGRSRASRHAFSRITMALLEDSGWYIPAWGTEGVNPWGYKSGCAFALSSCAAAATVGGSHASPSPSTCTADQAARHTELCTFDSISVGVCTGAAEQPEGQPGAPSAAGSLTDGCNTVQAYANGDCSSAANELPLGERSWGQAWGRADSRCILEDRRGEPEVNGTGAGSLFPNCYRMFCGTSREGAPIVHVVLRHGTVPCPSHATVDVSQEAGSPGARLGPCPDAAVMCGASPGLLTCSALNHCNGNGRCVDGRCRCALGFVGEACATAICIPATCRGVCHPASGLCIPVPASPSSSTTIAAQHG